MDVIFSCPSCKQQLEADSTLSGSSISCPACSATIVIPEPDPANVRTSSPVPHEEKHFVVPVTDRPTISLIEKPRPPLADAARKEGQKALQIKCIRHSDCVEVGKDRFEEVVSQFLAEIGEASVVNISTFNYSHVDLGTRAMLNDYGIMIVYRG